MPENKLLTESKELAKKIVLVCRELKMRSIESPIREQLLRSGTFEAHLIETNRRAEQMYSLLVKQYAAIERVNEELKKHNQMQWVGTMNNIHERVTEVINNELIYV